VLFEQAIEVLAKGALEVGQVHQVAEIFDAHQAPARIQSGAGHQAVKVRMKAQLLVPGVEHGGEAADRRPQSFAGQLFGKRPGHDGEEQIVSLPGVRPKEATAQLGRQGEGDEDDGQGVMILGADLGEDLPVAVAELIEEKHPGGGQGLADGFGVPLFLEFDEEEVVAQLVFGEGGGIGGEMFLEEAQLAVIGVTGAIGVVA
jgi:hypothetical protein